MLDEAWQRLHATGPEFDGGLSNHGPMAVDALVRTGQRDAVPAWIDRYTPQLYPRPSAGRVIDRDDRAAALGRQGRLADWSATMAAELADAPWRRVLLRWWPTLIAAPAVAATHPLIRTGHAVRALREHETEVRIFELGEALAYWAARWRPLNAPRPAGARHPAAALEAIAGRPTTGGFPRRLEALAADDTWDHEVAALRPPADIGTALNDVIDAALSGYARWGHGNPVMLVHAATAPRAAALVLPELPAAWHRATFDAAWACTAAVTAAYRAPNDRSVAKDQGAAPIQVASRAAEHGDEHVIKLTEVALEAHARGIADALAAAENARNLISAS